MDPSHHSKRRQYPQQQYDFNAPAAQGAGGPPGPGGYGYGYPAGPNANVNAAAADMAQLNLNTPGAPIPGGVQSPGTSGAPVGGTPGYTPNNGPPLPGDAHGSTNYGTSQYGTQAQALPLNELYNVDLMQNLPPPVNDLELPPPPLVLPTDATATGSEFAQAPPSYMRSTLNVIPSTSSLLKKSKLPFSVVITPSNALTDAGENVPLVTDAVISRCRRCRSYINPFVQFMDQHHRWRCSVCNLTNEVPTAFDWDAIQNIRQDRWSRKEINYGVVDFIAPPEYLVRPPQPPVYVFLLDVSVHAVSSGLLATAARVIQDSLDRLPNRDGRTRVAFICVDGALNFFHIPLPPPKAETNGDVNGDANSDEEDAESAVEPSLLVVSDLDDPYLPLPTGLLVNLKESRGGINKLLSNLGQTFANTVASSNALGSGLKAAHKLIANIGGKIICITASLPNVGLAKLDAREDRKVLGTPKEHNLFSPGNAFYKSFAVECNKSQVSVDMFLLSAQYQDVASLSSLPRYTGGQTYFYPGWTATRETDVAKLSHELGEHLSQEISMEAVLRLRGSTGIRGVNFYGNFFVRSSDLMAFACWPRDQSYVVDFTLDEPITKPWILIQAALLHTTSFGERRVRVLNLAIPVSNQLSAIYASADQLALANVFAHKAVEKAVNNGISDAQDYLQGRLLDILKVYKTEVLNTGSGSVGPLQLSANLRMLPLLIAALKKHTGLRPSNLISTDIRVAAMNLLTTLPVPHLIKYIYADFYSLHDMADEAGLPDAETGEIVLPPRLNLSGEHLQSFGLYLIDDGQVMFLWVGRDAVPQLLEDAFGVYSEADIKTGKTELPDVDTDLSRRIRAIVGHSRTSKDSTYYPTLYVVKENGDPALRLWATTFLVEDRTDQEPTYYQFLNQLRDKNSS